MAGTLRYPITLSGIKRFAFYPDRGSAGSVAQTQTFQMELSSPRQFMITLDSFRVNAEKQAQNFCFIIADTATRQIVVASYPYAMPVSIHGGLAIGIIRARDIAECYQMTSGQETGVGISAAADILEKCASMFGMRTQTIIFGDELTGDSLTKTVLGMNSVVGLDTAVANAYYVKPVLANGVVGLSCERIDIEAHTSLRDIMAGVNLSMQIDFDAEICKRIELEHGLQLGAAYEHFGLMRAEVADEIGAGITTEGNIGGYRWRFLRDMDALSLADIDNMTLGDIDMYLI